MLAVERAFSLVIRSPRTMPNFKRGFRRVYLPFPVVWVLWMLCLTARGSGPPLVSARSLWLVIVLYKLMASVLQS